MPYLWGTTGFAYNKRMILERMPDAPVTSGDMLFKPEVVKRFADCGVTFLDEPTDVIPMALLYLGRDPNSLDPKDLADVEKLLKGVRPYVRYFSSAKMLIDLPNEEVCIAMSWSGDYAQAMMRGKQVGKPVPLAYTTQKEGTLAWFDLWFILADAPHPDNAHLFLNYLLRPEVAAPISIETRYATPNLKAKAMLPPEVRNDPAVYPPESVQAGALHRHHPRPDARAAPLAALVPREDRPVNDPKASPLIQIRSVTKRFDGVTAVNDVSLDILRGELFAILGSSGCGKTTLLRMLAGFEHPTSGRILIDGVDMTDVPPYERPVNLMFQSYALFPHMTVEQNVAYGLKKERVPEPQIRERVAEMLALVKLGPLAGRKPDKLSGGEKQRVALARALVKRPKLLLLDEPLAALDRKLREHTQFELANLQYQLGTTFVVVTHDQDEAMTLASRIAVMHAGRIAQVGTPGEVYEYPANRYVAGFVGNINLIEGRVSGACERPRRRCTRTRSTPTSRSPATTRRAPAANSASRCGRRRSRSAARRRPAATATS